MSIDLTRLMDALTRLKLTAISRPARQPTGRGRQRELSLREALAFLVEREIAREDERRIEMANKIAPS